MSSGVTPNEILQKRFSHSFRGLKAEEVYEFLKVVAMGLEDLVRKNMSLSEKITQLQESLDEYREMESILKNTLISSQRIGQEIKEEAERKSSLRVQESNLEAERIIQNARKEKERLDEETHQLLNQHKRFRAEFLGLIETHRKLIYSQEPQLLLTRSPEDTPDPDIEGGQDEERPRETVDVGEDEIKDLEILSPDE